MNISVPAFKRSIATVVEAQLFLQWMLQIIIKIKTIVVIVNVCIVGGMVVCVILKDINSFCVLKNLPLFIIYDFSFHNTEFSYNNLKGLQT